MGVGVAVLVVLLSTASSRKPRPPEYPVHSSIPSPEPTALPLPPPPKPRNPFDEFLSECESLVDKGRFKEAIEKFDWFPTLGLSKTDSERFTAARSDITRKAEERIESRTKESESLAAQGRLQEAAHSLQDTADWPRPAVVGEAYLRLRRAAGNWLKAQRAESKIRIERELADLSTRLAAARPPSAPEEAWKRALERMERGLWPEAIDALSSLAGVPEWRERALVARAQAHHGAEQPVGVLLDARLLLESGKSVDAAVDWLNIAITRAPIDETVLDLYERAIERDPLQPRVWVALCALWTWRHDMERASETYDRTVSMRVPIPGPDVDRMIQYVQLRKRGFPHGNPVIVDYAGPYEILTDAPPKRVRELALQLESIAREYGAGFKYSVNPDFRFRVMFFTKDADFQRYYQGIFGRPAQERGIIAYYAPSIKQLVVVDSPGEFLETVRHEAFHQFLDYFAHNVPRWFNEGSAAYFEKATFGRPEFNARYQEGVREGLRRQWLPPLRELLLMPVEKWVGDPREGLFYCESWSFIFWLHKRGQGALWSEYLRLLVLGTPGQAAFDRVFSGKLDGLEREWKQAAQSGRYGD